MPALTKRRTGLVVVLVFGFWTLFALANSTGTYLYYRREEDLVFGELVLRSLPIWYLWALITLATLWLVQRFPLELPRWWRYVAVHTVAGILVAAGAVCLIALYNREVMWSTVDEPYLKTVSRFASFTFHYYILFYASIHGIYYAYDFYRKFRERELKASRLETQLANAQLDLLKMQLHPHFLFNTLNAISALMEDDVRTARAMIVHLSELLRLALDRVDVQEVTLDQELGFVERYLQIERVRFGDQLCVTVEVGAAERSALVPNLLLQPIVENALKHGAAPDGQVSRIALRAVRREDQLVISVEDNGPGLTTSRGKAAGRGIGLKNTRERLHQLYGASASLRLDSMPGGGLRVRVAVPYAPVFTTLETAG